MPSSALKGIRGTFVDCVQDPFFRDAEECIRFYDDGLLVLHNGRVKALGRYEDLTGQYPNLPIQTYCDRLIIPGLIDTHIHYPQTELIGSYGEQLLEWLDRYTFPTERKFADKASMTLGRGNSVLPSARCAPKLIHQSDESFKATVEFRNGEDPRPRFQEIGANPRQQNQP